LTYRALPTLVNRYLIPSRSLPLEPMMKEYWSGSCVKWGNARGRRVAVEGEDLATTGRPTERRTAALATGLSWPIRTQRCPLINPIPNEARSTIERIEPGASRVALPSAAPSEGQTA
jgi:hypothetical protein